MNQEETDELLENIVANACKMINANINLYSNPVKYSAFVDSLFRLTKKQLDDYVLKHKKELGR